MTNRRTRLHPACVIVLVLLLLLVPGLGVAYDRVVVFGDSLADAGNVFTLTGTIAHKPYAVVPSAPYPIGGMHFSDGETWVEQLAGKLGAESSAGPSLRAPGTFTNYAFGGARARDAGQVPSLTDQVTQFLADHGGQAPSDALYIVNIGGNDLRDAAATPSDAQAIIGGAVGSIATAMQRLYAHGARDFLVPNQPNLSVVPAITLQNDPAATHAALLASLAFNYALDAVLSSVSGLPGATVTRLDVFALTTQVAQAPASVGLANGTDPCLAFGVKSNAICQDRAGHFYWDGIHPTRAGHAVVAERALAALE